MLTQRKLGRQGLDVSALGLGCMGMSQSYGVRNDPESVATLEGHGLEGARPRPGVHGIDWATHPFSRGPGR